MSKKILVIDDADFILESTSTLLNFEGYDVYTASDGIEGVEKAKECKPDLILCDISMPGLDGYGVLDTIRADSLTVTTPFIFLTAFTEKPNMRIGMEKGADDFLVKPYTRDELIAAIDAQWKKHDKLRDKIDEEITKVEESITYSLPHEFRTVLNQVIGTARFIKEESQKGSIKLEELMEFTDDIIKSSERLNRITENFLIYVKVGVIVNNPSRKKSLLNERLDEPVAVAFDIADYVANRYKRKDDLVLNANASGVQGKIASESFHKILDELIDNAFKFSNYGTKVSLNAFLEEDYINFEIIDNGRGMKKEEIDNIAAYRQFERKIYEQQGVGLGLVIAKKLVEVHGGDFTITSEEGKWTKISLTIPCQASEE